MAEENSHQPPKENQVKLTEIERFWSKVDKSAGPGGCWNWTAGSTHGGGGLYGIFHLQGSGIKVRAHRYAFAMVFGPIFEGEVICHSCDNVKCVNPAHLLAGTIAENNQDKALKGRAKTGPRIPRTIAHRVRQDVAYGLTYEQVAIRYGITNSSVYRIVRGLYTPKPENGVKVRVPKDFSVPVVAKQVA
jgi:hypothetical protein